MRAGIARAARILNSYGPTEATVTATLTELKPDKPVTIGVPLLDLLDRHPRSGRGQAAVAPGELGEIGIAGVGLALGYINRDELTVKKFIRDFLSIQNNPSGRIYRTGDLGRINENGEIEYRGRIDTQVKIRGYRIELNEIEAVLLDLPQIAQAAVTTFEPDAGRRRDRRVLCLQARRGPAASPRSRRRCAASCPPTWCRPISNSCDVIPMTLSNKADHKKLPKPQVPRFSAAASYRCRRRPTTSASLARALAKLLKRRARVDRRSFLRRPRRQLAADGALLRRDPQEPGHVGRVDARHLHEPDHREARRSSRCIGRVDLSRPSASRSTSRRTSPTTPAARCRPRSTRPMRCSACGCSTPATSGRRRSARARSSFMRAAVLFAAGSFVVLTGISIAAKWLLIGRFKAQAIPIWSLRLFPLLGRQDHDAHLAGDGLHRHAALQRLSAPDGREDRPQRRDLRCRFGPVCADMFTIGDNTILRKDTIVLGYRAQSNFIHIGPVEIGANAFVGEASVIDIDTAMGDDTQLGHASSLQSGQRVPDGKRYHGSPAIETTSDYCPIETHGMRRVAHRLLHRARTRGADPDRRAGCRSSAITSGISIRPRPA